MKAPEALESLTIGQKDYAFGDVEDLAMGEVEYTVGAVWMPAYHYDWWVAMTGIDEPPYRNALDYRWEVSGYVAGRFS